MDQPLLNQQSLNQQSLNQQSLNQQSQSFVPDQSNLVLSLCLPTYKRAPLLREALEAVLAQIGPAEAGLVEVVVLDNASPDDTPAVVAACGQEAPHVRLRFVRHAQNIGMDANFLAAMQAAAGRFVCLLSDDDILLPGAVAKLLALIQAHPDFDGFCLNVSSFVKDPAEKSPLMLAVTEDTVLRSPDEVLRLVRSSITFLSVLVFRRARVEAPLATGKYADMIGTYCVQGYVYLDAVAASKNFVAVARPMVANRIENSHALNYFEVFITELTALLEYAQRLGFSRQVIQSIKADNLKDARYFITRVKIYGRQTEGWSSRPDALGRLFQVYGFHPYLWLVMVPLMFFPRFLRPLAFLVRRLLSRPYIAPKEGN